MHTTPRLMTTVSTDSKPLANSQLVTRTDCWCSMVDKSITPSRREIKS